jgi:hypothetical protein
MPSSGGGPVLFRTIRDLGSVNASWSKPVWTSVTVDIANWPKAMGLPRARNGRVGPTSRERNQNLELS